VPRRKIVVSFTPKQLKLLDRFMGVLGDSYPEIVRNIVLAYLNEKTYIKEATAKESS